MTASTVVLVLELIGLYVFATSGELLAITTAVFVFALRVVAMLRHWRAPYARVRF